MKEEIKIIVDNKEESNVVEIRTGDALPLLPIKHLVVNGVIDAPLQYISKRKAKIDLNHALIVVNEAKGTITFLQDENNQVGTIIKGELKPDEDLEAFGINKAKFYSLKELVSTLKMKRYYFVDKDWCNSLIVQLMGFKAKVETDLVQTTDNKGNSENQIKKSTTWGRDLAFAIAIPIFKGCEKRSFSVEICFEITDGSVKFWLESVELHELSLLEKAGKIKNVLAELEADFTIVHE